jgi:threonyl-tRNA synthetase
MLVVGAREAEADTLSLRVRHQGDRGSMTVDEFGARLAQNVARRALTWELD